MLRTTLVSYLGRITSDALRFTYRRFPILELASDSRSALRHRYQRCFAKLPVLYSILFHFGTTEELVDTKVM
jgi:hypothetical protein